MKQIQLRDVRRGAFIRRPRTNQTVEAAKTYRRGQYCRDIKRFECNDETDISHAIYLPGTTLVWVGFTY